VARPPAASNDDRRKPVEMLAIPDLPDAQVGDRVTVLPPYPPRHVPYVFAALKIGAISAPVP